MKTKNSIYAEKWFKLQDIPTIHKENKIFVIVGSHFEIEISEEEIEYRSELYLESELERLKQ